MVSILNSIKDGLGIPLTVINFDAILIIHINTALARLNGLGIPNIDSVTITDENDVWDVIIPSPTNLSNIKTYILLNVRLLFDPPQNSFLVKSIEDIITKQEFLIQVQCEDNIVDDGG